MPNEHGLEKYSNTEIESGFVSEVIDENAVAVVKGVVKSNAEIPNDIDLCIVKTIDVSDGVIKATGTNIRYTGFSVEMPEDKNK